MIERESYEKREIDREKEKNWESDIDREREKESEIVWEREREMREKIPWWKYDVSNLGKLLSLIIYSSLLFPRLILGIYL